MASQYYYARNGQRHGPVTSAELRGLAAAGQLGPEDLVWKEGQPEWLPARGIKGLFPAPAPELTVAPAPVAIQGSPSPPPAAPAAVPAGPSATPLPQRVLTEVRETANVTIGHVKGLVRRGMGARQGQQLHQKTLDAQAVLGRRLYEAGLGDAELRAQLDQIEERLRNLQAAKAATGTLEAERKGLYVRLAEPYLGQSAPPGLEKEHAAAVSAQAQSHTHRQTQTPIELVPADKDKRLRVALGCGAVALAGGVVSFCLVAAVGLVMWKGVGGNPRGPGSAKLVGTWEAKEKVPFVGLVTDTYEFRQDGGLSWKQKNEFATESDTAKWKVDRVEGNRYFLRIVWDSEPDRVKGMTVVFEDNDRFTMGEGEVMGFSQKATYHRKK